jgi:iron complex outermembrane receptor protein
MLKSLFAIAAAIACANVAQAQSIAITVQDAQTGTYIEGAVVQISNPKTVKSRLTSVIGSASFNPIEQAEYAVKVGMVGYETISEKLVFATAETSLVYKMVPITLQQQQVTVTAINTNKNGAYAYTNYKQADLAKQNFGQDMPLLLQFSPSAVATSDAGNGVGYSGLRIRGSDATRINVTLNGVPVNDAESQGLFWVNMPDLASSVSNLQIQRGVGTSTNGAAAFGGSINIETEKLQSNAYTEINNSYGSFNTWKNTAKFGTGLLKNKFAFNARLSQITSDGFIDRASSNLKSFYADGGYYGKTDLLKFVVMSGQERTYQAWNGVPADIYATNRTYNEFTYQNQVDNYNQSHYQLHYNKQFSDKWEGGISAFYTRGFGYYEEAQYTSNPFAETGFSTYGINPITLKAGQFFQGINDTLRTDTTLTASDIIRRKWLDNHFYGVVGSVKYQTEKFQAIFGGGYNIYEGDHFGEVIWARYAQNINLGDRYYFNSAQKKDFNFYSKLTWELYNNFNIFLDFQYRGVSYSFAGENAKQQDANTIVNLAMFNPKAGLSYVLPNGQLLYASYAVAQREPNRNDYVNALEGNTPQKEILNDFEAGLRKTSGKFQYSANLFFMNYQNQLVVTGALNEVGEFIRTNVGSSYRAGVELEAGTALTSWLNWQGNLTLSRNKVRSFVEIISGFTGPDDYIRNEFEETDIAFSPNIIGASQFAATFNKTTFAFVSKYVGTQYLDNTQNNNRRLDPYFVNDLRISYKHQTNQYGIWEFSLLCNNIFNYLYVSNGYTFSYRNPDTSIATSNYYYPQAGINFLGSVNIRF